MVVTTPLETPLLDELQSRRGNGLRRLPSRRTLSTAASILASTVALTLVLTWLALCRNLRNSRKATWLIQRHLSDHGEQDELENVLDECLALREELGIPEEIDEPEEQPANKKARLFIMLRDAASAFERARSGTEKMLQEGTGGLSHEDPARGPSQQVKEYPLVSQAPSDTVESEGTAGLPASVPIREPARPHTGVNISESSFPMLAFMLKDPSQTRESDNSLLLLQSGDENKVILRNPHTNEGTSSKELLWFESAHQQGLELKGAAADAPYYSEGSASHAGTKRSVSSSTDSPSTGSAGLSPDEWLQGSPDLEWEQRTHGAGKRMRLENSAAGTSAGGGPQGVEGRVEKGPVNNGEDTTILHPFVRLPQVVPKNIEHTFDGIAAMSAPARRATLMESYTSMRLLFAKPSLTATDVMELMRHCKGLVAYGCRILSRPPAKSNPYYAVRRLATLMMLFDYIVCTIELLGDRMDTPTWWSKFVEQFKTDYHFERSDRSQFATVDLAEAASRFSAALDIYKTGQRPPLRTVIALKQEIFATLRSHSIFGHPAWSSWVTDDEAFRQITRSPKK